MKISYSIIILFLLPVSLRAADNGTSFFGTGIFGFGDPQCGSDGQKENKKGHIACLLRIIQESKNKSGDPELADRTYAVAFPGDINQGTSGHGELCYKYRWFLWFLKHVPSVNADKQQTKEFKEKYLKPLKKEKIKTFLGVGNHDYWDFSQAALDLVADEHGSMYYAERLGNILYINCAVWPDKKITEWLKETIAKDHEKKSDTKIVIAFHYNILGNHYKWWTKEERDDFLAAIQGKNVQLIITGHDHQTYTGSVKTGEEKIPVVCTGGKILSLSLFDVTDKYQKTVYFKAREEADGSFTPEPVDPHDIPTLSMLIRESTKEEDASCAHSKLPINQEY
jgi:hypothetical protein